MKTQDIKNIATALKNIREADMKPEVKKALAKSSAASEKGKKAVTLPKAPFKMEGAGLDYNPAKGGYNQPKGKEVGKRLGTREAIDPVDKKELKGKHKDRKDKDIDNDGDVDSSDEYLHKRRKAVSKGMKEGTLDFENMADEEFNEILEASNSPEELEELIGAIARGAGSLVKKVGGAAGKAVVSRVTTAGRAKRAQAKLKKMKTKVANRKKLDTAKTGIAALRKSHSSITGKPKQVPIAASKNSDVEVQEAATATQKPNNGADAEDGLSPNGKKMMAMKTDAPEGADITKVAPKTFAAMRASGKKAAMRSGDNATGESKIKPSATDAK